jgi:hypothetical protein
VPVASGETALPAGIKVFTIAQTPVFVAASMAPGWELDGYCADESIDQISALDQPSSGRTLPLLNSNFRR